MCNAMKIVGLLFDADDVRLEECVHFSAYTIGTMAIAVTLSATPTLSAINFCQKNAQTGYLSTNQMH